MDEEKRLDTGVRLRKLIDVVIEEPRSYTLLRGTIADISTTGMRVIADQYLPRGTRYTFTMKKPPALVLRGEVRWVRASESPDTFQCGVQFVDLDDAVRARLENFVEIERMRVPSSSP